MTFHRITDAIPEFDTENADGGMTDTDTDGAVTEAGASGTDGIIVSMGSPWRRITKGSSASLNQISVPTYSFTRLA